MDSDDEEDIDDNLEENEDDDDVSDFDDDEDPDKIEIPVAVDLAGTSASSVSTSAVEVKKAPPVQLGKPTVTPNASYTNGKPVISPLGLPILPVNTATTRVGGSTVARRGGLAGQPFTSEYSLRQ